MASLLLVAFLLQLAVHVVNTVGATTINELLWLTYSKLPTPTAQNASEAARLRLEVIRLKKELGSISAQDEFSRWAKVRRQHDKAVAAYDKQAESVKSTKATFDKAANTLRWFALTGVRLLMQFWYSRRPMFWIPQGWLPAYAEWILAFPRAPTGSVSMQVWWIACTTVIVMVSEAVMASYVLVQRQTKATGRSREPMAHKTGNGIADDTTTTEEIKQEL